MPKYIPIHTNTCSLIQYVPIRPLHIPDELIDVDLIGAVKNLIFNDHVFLLAGASCSKLQFHEHAARTDTQYGITDAVSGHIYFLKRMNRHHELELEHHS